MGIRDLRERYGPSKKGREVMNVAVRAEISGGNEALDAIGVLLQLQTIGREEDAAWRGDVDTALASLKRVADAMRGEVARRYELKTAEKE